MNTKTTELKTKKAVLKKVEKTVLKPVFRTVDNKTSGKAKMRKVLTGTVVSTKMQKTVVVAIERKVAHKLYRKLLRVTKKIKADTNGMDIKEGDIVKIEQTRPLSKGKNFKVIKKEEAK